MIVFFENDPTVVQLLSLRSPTLVFLSMFTEKSTTSLSSLIAQSSRSLCGKNFQRLDYMNVEADLWKAVL
eukprot:3727040-Rhodomonas_salina.1